MTAKGTARYDIVADDKSAAGWRSAIATANANGKKLKSSLSFAFAGFVGIQTFTSSIAKAVEFGDGIGKMSVKLALGAKETSELAAAAKQFDIEIDAVGTSLKKMQIAISQANSGNKEARETFRALGIDFRQLSKLSTDKQFESLAEAISKLKDPTDRTRAAVALFGKSGADLLPMFEEGARGIQSARREAQEFGTVLSDIDVKKLQEADDAMKRLKASTDGLALSAASFGGGFLAGVADAARRLIGGATELEKLENQLRILRETEGSIPIFLNFGFTDGPTVMGPTALRTQIANLEARIRQLRETANGVGSAPLAAGVGGSAAPGYAKADKRILASREDWKLTQKEIDEQIRTSMENWRGLVDATDVAVREDFFSTFENIGDVITDLNEPVLQLSESLIRADAIQDEFSRSMFNNFSDLFYSIGEGTDDMADQFLRTIKRMLADRATLALFDAFKGAGTTSGTTASGGGFWAGVGSFVSSIFGGYKADGGPLSQNKWYIAGERGPEPIWGGGPGAFAMGYGQGTSVSISSPVHIDARGASPDSVKEMRRMLDERDQRLKSDIIVGIRTRKYKI